MKRRFALSLAAGLMLSPLAAPGLTILHTIDRPEVHVDRALELRDQHIDVAVRGSIATTTVKQVVHNPNNRVAEGVFLIPLPRGAQATELVMEINGKKVAADTLGAGEARQIYTDIVRQTKDPGLLEYLDATTLRIRLFPVPANGDMPVELTLVQPLARDGGAWAYELPGGPASTTPIDNATMTLTVESDMPLASIFSPTHELATRYDRERTRATVTVEDYAPGDGRGVTIWMAPEPAAEVGATLVAYRPIAGEDGTFMLRLHPPTQSQRQLDRTVVFMLDTSGSMAEDNKMAEARKALAQCLGFLNEKDTFALVAFATSVESLSEKPLAATPANIAAARAWLDERQPRGGTNIGGALDRALSMTAKDRIAQIIFLTDGQPTVGPTEPVQIMDVARRGGGASVRVFPLGVGHDVNSALLDQLAEETRALPTYIAPGENIEVRVSNFFETVASPVRGNLALRFDGIETSDVFPQRLPDLFAGRDVAVYGRYKGAGPARVTLTGEDASGPFETTFTLDFAASTGRSTKPVATLWAARQVAFLLDEIRRHGDSPELVEEVTSLGLEHHLVTPYTSFLAADDSEFDPRRRGPGPLPPLPRGGVSSPLNPGDDRIRTNGAAGSTQTRETARPAAMPQQQTGADAFNFSKSQEELRASSSIGDAKLGGGKDASAAMVRVIDGTRFEQQEGIWKDTTPDAKKVVVEVVYLSDAYFALLDRYPDRKEALLLGERVWLVIGETAVHIGPRGVENAEELPASLAGGLKK